MIRNTFVFVLFFASSLSTQAQSLVGTLPGSLSVDNKGAANYVISLPIPPGRSGLQPNLALEYSSGAGNGALGVGWTVSTGFPQAITRGRSILARDGYVAGAAFAASDKFYLDGKRMVLVSPSPATTPYIQVGNEYRTEVESFVSIMSTAYSGSSIEGFNLSGKNGVQMYFGATDAASADALNRPGLEIVGTHVPRAWSLKKVRDAAGNEVILSYNNYFDSSSRPTGEQVISQIEYTAGSSIDAQFRVRFLYSPELPGSTARQDQRLGYSLGKALQAHRLEKIVVEARISAGWSEIRSYGLSYENSASTGMSRLKTVSSSWRESESAGWQSLPATEFTYDNSGAIGASLANPTDIAITPSGFDPALVLHGDFDGDGKTDEFNGGWVRLSNGASFGGAAQWINFSSTPSQWANSVKIGDLDGDGKQDIVWVGGGSQNIVYAARSNGSGFEPLSGPGGSYVAISASQAWFDAVAAGANLDAVAARVSVGDFNGDGRKDILLHTAGTNGAPRGLYVAFANGVGFDAPVRWGDTLNSDKFRQFIAFGYGNPQTVYEISVIQPMVADYNGDGVDDYAWGQREVNSGFLGPDYSFITKFTINVATSLPKNGQFSLDTVHLQESNASPTITSESYVMHCLPADCNGDGLVDLLVLGRDVNLSETPTIQTKWILYLNTGGSFRRIVNYMPTTEVVSGVSVPTHNVSYAQNLEYIFETYYNNSSSDWAATNITLDLNRSCNTKTQSGGMFLQDINHDGLADYIWCVGYAQGWWVKYGTFDGFAPAQKLWDYSQGGFSTALGGYNAATDQDGNGGVTLESIDIDGDGNSDLLLTAINSSSSAAGPALSKGLGTMTDSLVKVVNGLSSETTVDYSTVADSSIYTVGAAVAYPIREIRSGVKVVASVSYDSGSSTPTVFSYQYSGARTDLAGRGFLGFHSFVTLDHQTNLFKYQFLTQSFPMTGLTAREETYRYLGGGNFRYLSSHDNTVVFDQVSNGSGGTYGTVYPFISKAVEYRWENDSAAHFSLSAGGPSSQPEALFPQAKPSGEHIKITAESRFDDQSGVQTTLPGLFNPSDTNGSGQNSLAAYASYSNFTALSWPTQIRYGNLKQLTTDFGGGFTESVTTSYKPPVGALTGLVDTVTTTVASPGYGTESAPTRSYTYWNSTPLVATETVDATDNKLDLTTTYARDARGRIENTIISGYDNASDPQHVGSYSVFSATAFDDRFDLPTAARNAAPYQHTTTTAYHDLFGQPVSVTDANAAQVTTAYDALGRPTLVTDVLKGLSTSNSYEWDNSQTVSHASGLTLTSVYKLTTTATVRPSVSTYYDRLGRPIRSIKDGFGGQQIYNDTIYNTLGQVVAASLPYPSGGPIQWTTTTYDPLGRVDTVTAPNGTVTTNTYIGRATKVSVDAVNLGGADPAAQVNTTLVDAKGRTVKVWNADNVPAFSDTLGSTGTTASIGFALDGFGRMRSTTLKGQSQTITASYDALGRQTQLADPDKGTWNYVNNVLGQVVSQTDANANTTTTSFDHLGRPFSRVTAGGGAAETANFYYYDVADNAGLHVVAKGNQGWIGAPQREEAGTVGAPGFPAPATVNLHYYDNKGRSSLELAQLDGQWFYTYSDYDAYSRVEKTRHYWRPAGYEAATARPYVWESFGYTYAYDARSYLLSLTDSTNRSWWSNPVYDHLDRITSVKKGNGHTTTRSYRASDGVLTDITTGGGAIQSLTYGFDGLGNLRSRTGTGGTETLGYDDLNRLTSSSKQGATSYLSNGNIDVKRNISGDTSGGYGYSSAKPHAVVSAWGYALGYDNNGNLTSRTQGTESWSLNWTGFDKPRWMAKTTGAVTLGSEFHYNASRSRVMQLEFDAMASGSPSHYTRKRLYGLGSTLEANYKNLVTSGTGTNWQLEVVRIYIAGPDGMIGSREFSPLKPAADREKAYVYHHDHLGSIDVITPFGSTANAVSADAGGKAGRFSEDAWGQRRNPLTWSGAVPSTTDDGGFDSLTPRGFTGHEMLDDLGLVHMNGRIYDPLLGRFLSADLLVQAPGDLQAYNRYSYVKNNPLTLTDPSGFAWIDDLKKFIGSLLPDSTKVQLTGQQSSDGEAKLANASAAQGVEKGIKALEKAADATNTMVKSTPILGQVVTGANALTGKNVLDPTGRTTVSRASEGGELVAGLVVGAVANKLAPVVSRAGGKVLTALKGEVDTLITGGAEAAKNGLSRSATVSADRAESLLMKYGGDKMTAERAKDFTASFDGPITARIAEPGEGFLRYTDIADSKGSFLSKTFFGSPDEAVTGLYLSPYGNNATLRQQVTATGRSIVLEGGVANGAEGVQQSLIVNRNAFQFGTGTGF